MTLADYINKSKGLIKKESMNSVKLAFLSNFTINGLQEIMKVLAYEHNIYAETYLAPYGQYFQEILNKSSNLYNFKANMIFILIDAEHFLGDFYYFFYRLDKEQRKEYIEKKFEELKELIITLEKDTDSKIIINSLLLPIYSSKGILENKEETGLKNSIQKFNDRLEKFAIDNAKLFVFDINNFCSKVGYNNFRDWKINYLGDMKISPSSLVNLGNEYMSYIFPLMSLTKKCIVLDLDNTLWGGVIGEDGIENIKLGPEKEGKPFMDFQKRLLELFERGIILAINSKNNYEEAMNVIRNHEYMVLKEDNFASVRINWNDKASNMRELAKELNLGLDSFVFIDDDKTNRAFIKETMPEVMVIDFPEDPSLYIETIENLKVFNTFSITEDDFLRGKMYALQKKRNYLESATKDLDSFLKQLEIKLTIGEADKLQIPRIAQLTQKTNQFNLTTKRYTEEDIQKLANSEKYLLKFIQVKDKFGNYGITGVAIIKRFDDKDLWEIDSFLLSCRILGKNIEFAFMKEIIEKAKIAGIKEIYGEFLPTKKNLPAKDFLVQCGFELYKEDGEKKMYKLNIEKEKLENKYIEILEWKP